MICSLLPSLALRSLNQHLAHCAVTHAQDVDALLHLPLLATAEVIDIIDCQLSIINCFYSHFFIRQSHDCAKTAPRSCCSVGFEGRSWNMERTRSRIIKTVIRCFWNIRSITIHIG